MRALLILAAIALLLGCQTAPSENVEADVYRAVLRGDGGDLNDLVNVARQTTPAEISVGEVGQCAPGIRFHGLGALRTGGRDLTAKLASIERLRLLNPTQVEAVAERTDPERLIPGGASIEDAVKTGIASRVMELSGVGFDSSGRHAVLQIGSVCGRLCGVACVLLLDRNQDGTWPVSPRQCGGGWVS